MSSLLWRKKKATYTQCKQISNCYSTCPHPPPHPILPPTPRPCPWGLYNMRGFLKPFERCFLPSSEIKYIIIVKLVWEHIIKNQLFLFIMKIRKISQIYFSLYFKLNDPQFEKKHFTSVKWQKTANNILSVHTSDCPQDCSCVLS